MSCNKLEKKENKNISFNLLKIPFIIRVFLFLISILFLPVILIFSVILLFGYIVMNDNNIGNKISGWVINIGKLYNKSDNNE